MVSGVSRMYQDLSNYAKTLLNVPGVTKVCSLGSMFIREFDHQRVYLFDIVINIWHAP